MPACDMCGREGELLDAIVEGASMRVCNNCSKFGRVITVKPKVLNRQVAREAFVLEQMEVIVDDYAELIRKAREKKDLKQHELAKQIGEKESVIRKLETGHFKPSLKLGKKLELVLGIKLIESYKNGETKKIDLNDRNLTIGDLIRAKNE